MKKKYIIEIVIAALLVLAELIVILCTYSEALHAPNTDIFITSIIAIFTNIEVLYGIGLAIFNSAWRKQ